MRALHPSMRQRLLLPLLLCACAVLPAAGPARGQSGAAPAASDESTRSLSTAPDFTGKGVDGKTYALRDLLAQGPVLVDFWTTWCKPCMMEIPQLQKIYDEFKGRGFTLLGVVSDDQKSAAKIKPTIASKGFKFPNVGDADRRICNLYNVRNYPTSVLIAPDGKIMSYTLGYRPGDEKELREKIAALLDGASGAAPAAAPAEKSEAGEETGEGGSR